MDALAYQLAFVLEFRPPYVQSSESVHGRGVGGTGTSIAARCLLHIARDLALLGLDARTTQTGLLQTRLQAFELRPQFRMITVCTLNPRLRRLASFLRIADL